MPTTVDKIRRALEKRDGIAEDEMRPLADAYRTQVQEVNQRLDDAVMLLRKGLRSEAIQRVEMTPNALDAATELEFPEWDEWNEILQFMGIPLPPKLNQDYVAQINEAIIESLPLDALLRRHRRLAIAKAPLSVRLRTLRQIARVDSANSVWNEDVEDWEKVRLGQIDNEMKFALENENARTLYQLHRELTSGPWRITPSTRIVEQCQFAAESHLRDNQDGELKGLAPKLAAAYEKRDETTARALRNQWHTVRSKFNVGISLKLENQVAPAIRWLEDLDRQAVMESERQMAVSNLESALASGAAIEDVQAAHDQASRFGAPVPAELSERVQQLARKPAQAAKRKIQFIAAGVGALVIAGVVGGVLYLASARTAKAKQDTVDQMKRFVSGQQYDQALTYFGTVQTASPDVAILPEMVAMHATAKQAVDDEIERAERFGKLIEQASNDDPALIDATLIPQLEELAMTDGERSRVADLKVRKAAYFEGEAARQSDEMMERLSELQSSFNALQSRGVSKANRDAIGQLLSSVIRLPNEFQRSSPEVRNKQQLLKSEIQSTLNEMKDQSMVNEQRAEAVDALAASRSVQVYADRLREFATRSVSRTGFADFQTVLREEDHWLGVDRTNAWLASARKQFADGVSSSEALELLESSQNLRSAVYPNPALDQMPTLEPTLEEIMRRRQILSETFMRIEKHPLTRIVTLPIENSGVTTNYLLYNTYAEENAKRMARTGSIGVEVVSDELGGVSNRAFQGPVPSVIDEPAKSIRDVLSEKSNQMVAFDQKWEQTFLILISQVVRNENLDGVVKEWLIYYLMDAATRGSERLAAMVPQTMQLLKQRRGVREKWYETRTRDTSLNPKLERVLKAELRIAFPRFADPYSKLVAVTEQRLRWVGFLTKSHNGPVEFQPRDELPEEDGKFYVAIASNEGDTETQIVSIGKLENGHVMLTPNPVHKVPGRPVFYFAD